MYATADDMRTRYGETALVQLTGAPEWGAQAIAAINLRLADATAIADGYVARYHSRAPGRPVPPLLVALVCAIAWADMTPAPTETAVARRREAIAQLEQIARGLIKLDQGDVELPARDGAVLVEDPGRVFGRDRMAGF